MLATNMEITRLLAEDIYQHFVPVEQKRCCWRAKDQLHIVKMALKNCYKRLKNDDINILLKKAYDMVPHSNVFKCLFMMKAAKSSKNHLKNSMRKWKNRFDKC